MAVEHRVPLLFRQLVDRVAGSQAGIVHEDVETAEGIGRSLDDPLGAVSFHQVFADRNRLASRLADFVGHDTGRALALGVGSEVAHYDLCAFACQRQRFASADAAPAARDDCNLSRESRVVHFRRLLLPD